MSSEETFLARWSRRKQAVAEAEKPAPPAPDASAQDEPVSAEAARAAPVDVAALPKLEDLTAESDLSAFLRDGVPQALKSAALRKMWSLDPAIRDFVGLSENAWNFNEPATIPGFGTIAESARDVFVRAALGEPRPPAASPPPADAAPPAEAADSAPSSAPCEPPVATADDRLQESPPAGGDAEERRPRHGGAAPR
jgi:hypothetical protein